MIYDCFPAFQELDIVRLRLAQLAPVVDRFVIVEADRTHRGTPKPMHLRARAAELAEWADKIYWHVAVLPEGEGADAIWRREIAQRNAILEALRALGARPDDMIMISDADEIPRREYVRLLGALPTGAIAVAQQRLYYYTFNHVAAGGGAWLGTRAAHYADVVALTPDGVRYAGRERGGYPQLYHVTDAGWHLSYFGGVPAIQHKISEFLHQELNTAGATDPAILEARIAAGHDVYGRDEQRFDIVTARDLPDAVYERPAEWAHLFHAPLAPVWVERWTSGQHSTTLAALASTAPPGGGFLEIGAWQGMTTIPLAYAAGDRALEVVDTWAGNADEDAAHDTVREAQQRDVYAEWLHNVAAHGLTNIVAQRMDWREWAARPGRPLAFVYIDASHDYASVAAQIDALLPRMVAGGIIAGDDFYAPGVAGAALDRLPGLLTNGRIWYWTAPALEAPALEAPADEASPMSEGG